MTKKQEDRTIKLDNEEIAKATFPIVISVSRSTDIPAFYADWFLGRLKKGYSAWTNPFNGKKSYVAYEDTRFIVFWSKNPRPLLNHLGYLRERGIGCYIQYTLNDYEDKKALEAKGYVGHKTFGSTYQYYPVVTEEEFSRRTLGGVIRKYFENSYLGAVSALVEEEKISVDELRELIDRIATQNRR